MRKIAIVTTTRAEYGLLKNLIADVESDSELQLQLLVSGTHLSAEFGETYKEIEADFTITKKVPFVLHGDSAIALTKSMASLQIEMTQTLDALKPDIIVLLGDRYEILSIAIAAMMLNIPIAHIHGGETTEGAIDEAVRHSITKMSHLHFCATGLYRKRVIQLGEAPQRVFNVGSLGVQNVEKMDFLSQEALEQSMGFQFAKKNLLITFHPVTLEKNSAAKQCQNLLDALELLTETHLIFTKSNADRDNRVINSMIDAYVAKNTHKAIALNSLGQHRYFSALHYVDAVVGNSSSGIIEAPSFHIATINIGERQKGREQSESIINVPPTKEAIFDAIERIYTEEFQEVLSKSSNPYQAKNTSKTITEILKTTPLQGILKKSFFDLK